MSLAQDFNGVLTEYLRPATSPVWVKLSSKEELPDNVRSPQSIFGHRLALCQGIAIARRYNWTLGFTKKDNACALSVVEFGMVEYPEELMDGRVVYPLYAEDMEAGKRTEEAVPKMEPGAVNSIIVGSLAKIADDDYDVVLVYGNPAQIVRLIQAALYKEGGAISSQFSGRAACCSQIITPYRTQECNVIIPGGGEKVFALTGDDEMSFAIPTAKISGVMEGLVETHKAGAARIPTPFFGMRCEPIFPSKYQVVEDYLQTQFDQ